MLILNRISQTQIATHGVFLLGGVPICHTLELPWLYNQKSKSCIPPGKYRLTKSNSQRFGAVFNVHDVPNRSAILIHAGNKPEDTEGCILPGLGTLAGNLQSSRLAISKLYAMLPNDLILDIWSTPWTPRSSLTS